MTLEQWALVAEIVAAGAVVASLIYLAIQIRQSNVLARAQTRQVMMQTGQEELRTFIDDPSLYVLWTKEELSQEERIRLHSWLIAHLRQREYEWLERQEGLIDQDMFAAYSRVTAVVLGTERTRRWWKRNGQSHAFDPRFVAFVDDLLDRSPMLDPSDLLAGW